MFKEIIGTHLTHILFSIWALKVENLTERKWRNTEIYKVFSSEK